MVWDIEKEPTEVAPADEAAEVRVDFFECQCGIGVLESH